MLHEDSKSPRAFSLQINSGFELGGCMHQALGYERVEEGGSE